MLDLGPKEKSFQRLSLFRKPGLYLFLQIQYNGFQGRAFLNWTRIVPALLKCLISFLSELLQTCRNVFPSEKLLEYMPFRRRQILVRIERSACARFDQQPLLSLLDVHSNIDFGSSELEIHENISLK